jgi:predicted Rossmann-fold nucleotide-binding protein
LLTFLDHAVTQRFLKAEHRTMALCDDDPERLLDQFATYRPPTVNKWAD